jgi:hypothetical protein
VNDLPNEKPLWINRAGEGVLAAKSYLCKRWQIHPLWKERKQGERVPKESHKGVQIPPNKEQGTRNKELSTPPNPPQGGAGFFNVSRLRRLRSKDLQSLRSKLIDERNSGSLSREEKDAKREQLLEIKRILKTRGIEYAASV